MIFTGPGTLFEQWIRTVLSSCNSAVSVINQDYISAFIYVVYVVHCLILLFKRISEFLTSTDTVWLSCLYSEEKIWRLNKYWDCIPSASKLRGVVTCYIVIKTNRLQELIYRSNFSHTVRWVPGIYCLPDTVDSFWRRLMQVVPSGKDDLSTK